MFGSELDRKTERAVSALERIATALERITDPMTVAATWCGMRPSTDEVCNRPIRHIGPHHFVRVGDG